MEAATVHHDSEAALTAAEGNPPHRPELAIWATSEPVGGALIVRRDPSRERDLATRVSRRLGYSLSASASAMYSDRCPAVSAWITLGSLSP